ncbi:GmrSD restriction endonuclease domain-containing protein [Aurantimonas sp. A3-2-R12]|uniref:GmrSD restriction endonuclease domain-containing protein n=1 Tax=Aurantimonas sp. A3-2-R12 TaxID=3114362 RepID=UPI002E178E92|nr:DUF262 domain-containing protein [Aurantimonas sp. A3-2-R12]
MKAQQEIKTIRELIQLKQANMLSANPEYQRGAVWSRTQQRKLVDSVMRGYPLPVIYLHHIKTEVAGMAREDLEIIDGQQRINALYEFAEGAFTLFDPVTDDVKARFPAFIKAQPCPWAGKNSDQLDPETRKRFLDTPLSVAMIETDQVNEVRDLFVRLQSGLPLNAQETRDAWPGQFTEFALKLGGKPELARYPGHGFFTRTLEMKPSADRGKTRQLAAQLAMLFLTRRAEGADKLCDINAGSINEFYYSNLDFDAEAADPQRLLSALTTIETLLIPGQHPKLRGHDAIHALLLVDSLMDDYAPSWQDRFPNALDSFLAGLANAKSDIDGTEPDEFWTQYGQWTRVNSDRGDNIARRHRFYMRKMHEFLQPLTLKDPQRLFGEIERTILFFDQGKSCAECGGSVAWNDCEIHHVVEHSQGGQTTLENAALVHKACHPKGEAKTKAFASKFAAAKVGAAG